MFVHFVKSIQLVTVVWLLTYTAYSLVAYNHHISSIEEQKELFEKYTKRLQVVREIKEQQNIEFQGMSFTVLINSLKE